MQLSTSTFSCYLKCINILFAASKRSVKPTGTETPSTVKPLAPHPSPVRRPALSSPSTRWNPPGKPLNLSFSLGQDLVHVYDFLVILMQDPL